MATTEELARVLKDLPLKIQTASLTERKNVFDNVKSVLTNPGFNENVVRGLCKVVQMALSRYRDSMSQSYLTSIVGSLSLIHPEWTLKHLSPIITEVANGSASIVPTKSTAQSNLYALTWSALLLTNTLNKVKEELKSEIKNIINAQAILLTSILAANNQKKSYKAQHILSSIWKSDDKMIILYEKGVLALPESPSSVVFGSIFVNYLHKEKHTETINSLKARLVELLVKTVIGSKTRIPSHVVTSCKPLLVLVNHSEFSEVLLPSLQKALLRNPELTLHVLDKLLANVSIDLSKYAVDLGKTIANNLCSNDDETRHQASEGLKALATQCSDPDSISALATHLFQDFSRSQGKITVASHKLTILQGIGNLSFNAVTGGSVKTLAQNVAEQFVKILEVEVHEKTLVHCLEMMSLWCAKFTTSVPDNVIAWLEKGIGLKSSTLLVRISYIETMSVCCRSATASQTSKYIPLLLKSVEKAATQPTQALVVTEGLSAACLLLKLSSYDSLESKLGSLYSIILDMEKQIFLSEKFLSQASTDALCHVVKLCEKILMEHMSEVIGSPVPLYRALVICLTTRAVKVKCKPMLQRMFSSLHGTQIAIALFEEFTSLLISNKFANTGRQKSEKNKETEESNNEEVKPKHLIEAITILCSGTNLSKDDKNLLAYHLLVACHHPIIVTAQSSLWIKMLKYFKLDSEKFIKQHVNQLTKLLIENFTPHPSYVNALRTVTKLNHKVILPPLLVKIKDVLSDQDLLNVSDREYEIFLCPPNELYDKSVISNKDNDSSLNIKNMKRESKVYSYKEQQEEIALRKELEDKKRKEGKLTEPELTPKQKEMVKIQLEKEAFIRNRLRLAEDKLVKAYNILLAACQGAPMELSLEFPVLIPLIIRGLNSPLCAKHLSDLYIYLRKSAFLGVNIPVVSIDKITHTALRLLKPKCQLDPSWEDEDLGKAMKWTINEIDKASQEVTAPALTFLLPMIQCTVNCVSSADPLLTTCIHILSTQCKLRTYRTEPNLHSPTLLPRKQIMMLCIEMISSTTGRIQQQASACLLELANASCGAEGCAVASIDEIECLLMALQHSSHHVRDAALRALLVLIPVFPKPKNNADQIFNITKRLWAAQFDIVVENRTIAQQVWEAAKLKSNLQGLSEGLLQDIVHPVVDIQQAAAEALHAILQDSHKSEIDAVIVLLLNIYNEKNVMIPARLDSLGRVVDQPIDTWEPRSGVALGLAKLAPLLSTDNISELAKFYVGKGLGDRHATVRNNMLAAALAAVDLHGKDTVNILLPILEPVLDKGPDCSSYDAVRQSVVILMGSLARHLDKDDKKIKPIVAKLIDALSTPSQQVQEAVANCLPALVPSIKEEAPGLVQRLLDQLLKSESYGQRKGAAYGLAGIVKGMGILVLKQLDIMTTLTTAIQDKKNYRHREGALFAFEMLCSVLGRLFEPYIVHVLPHLLLCFGDSSQYVRDATDDCAKVVMSKLSAHGVKLVLPSLLAALEKDSWRTKTGSVELLGAMAFCAPKQLSSCLPSIVPKLIEVLSDSHVKVQNAGTEALKQIGSVIRNPEIQAIVPILLEALQDPSNKTAMCLQTLLDTQFVHFIDAPSLALIMPVVQRAFMDRSTETRKMAAQIIGNMYSLTDQKDLTPYLPTIIPGLKTSLLDPVPEVRSVSARALGAMVRGMGEASFEDLLPWLMKTLTSESSSVDRSGAAQGLSEVVGGLGVEKLHKLMPEIISTAVRADIAPHVKDGYIMMFIYMPVVFTNEFTPYIGEIIIPILKALADENEYVRDTALKAGQRIVNLYADSAITLLLPELEKGLFDENWRIRYSSVQLLGDLLYRISGVSGKMSTETANEDDNFGTEQSHKAIIGALGAERRNRVLAGLYMGRSDVALMVRQAALHVWKVVVTNTPRTLREILPTLFNLLLGCLASTSHDKRQVAAKTLGDLVRKLGERVLPEIIPILEKGLESERADQRQGVCIGLSEMMASTSRDMILTFVNSLVPTVRKALCDPLPEVRQAAAKTFDSLHSTVGVRALDDILPPMLQQLNNPDPSVAEWTLDGLRQVMAIKSRVVLPYLVPQLTAPPINTKALSILASVAGEALTKYLNKILPALLTALAASDCSTQELEFCQTVVLSVLDEAGICAIITQLLEAIRSEKVETRRASATLICAFCTHTRADYSQHVPQLLRGLIISFTDNDATVLQMSWEALSAVTKSLDASQQIQYVSDIRTAVKFAVSDLKNGETLLPGLCLPKGITPVLPLFREAILNGSPEIKEAAAQGLGEVISLTTAQSLQPSVINITGPLIRILGDRFPPTVKAAVLHTLAILLGKVGMMLKQFLPQLQTTFLKALNDSNRLVRLKAATALSYLITIHTRPDPLFIELHNSVKNAEEPAVRETMMQALRGVVSAAGDKMSESVLKTIYVSLLSMLSHSEDTTRSGAAGCVGAFIRWLPDDMLPSTMSDTLLVDDVSIDWTLRHGRSATLFVAMKEAPNRIIVPAYEQKVHKVLLSFLAADRVQIVMNGVRGCGYLFDHLMNKGDPLPQPLLSQFVRAMNHSSNEVKQLVAKVCSFLAHSREITSTEFLKTAIPMLVNGTKEKNSYVKANSEFSLVNVLRLRQGDDKLQATIQLLDAGASEALSDVITKVLRKVAVQPEGKYEELDDTLLI
ncbi:eIF-2-alpha kinase activator GCN1 [Cimex lectularius]|uniref:TOG domain-containing protein n=1 Tax=Cimex lectularius TaxID=79782 RepID=A0A8I6SBQ0_CIMLE|nr:eIF-2-alpha kinase activator GCN1 [Cimex lectularius]